MAKWRGSVVFKGANEYGKGDLPRNMGPLFQENIGKVDFSEPRCEGCGKILCMCK